MTESSAPEISAHTRLCAVLGHPIRHSASPAMHNAALRHHGLDWRYLAFEVRPEELGAALAGARSMRFIGLNLTVPHKLLAMPLVDELDVSARAWGAVNTVRFEGKGRDGAWCPLGTLPAEETAEVRSVGFNTDADAIVTSLREDLEWNPPGRRVLLLGAGGAGRVAALRLAEAGVARLHLVNRTASRAESLAREIVQRYPTVEVHVGYPSDGADLVLNATSLGLRAADPSPLDSAVFALERAHCLYDMIYRPAETPLLKSARAAGCRVANGLGMLLYQGARALELWTGRPAPVAIMRAALERNIYGGPCS